MENQELNKSFEAAKKAAQEAINSIQGAKKAIRENHMVNLPLVTPEVDNEIETQIGDILYLVNYRGEVTDPTFEDEQYEIIILSICQCPVADVDGEYIPLEKIEKEIYDQLLQIADDHYRDNFLSDDCMDFDNSSCAYDQIQL